VQGARSRGAQIGELALAECSVWKGAETLPLAQVGCKCLGAACMCLSCLSDDTSCYTKISGPGLLPSGGCMAAQGPCAFLQVSGRGTPQQSRIASRSAGSLRHKQSCWHLPAGMQCAYKRLTVRISFLHVHINVLHHFTTGLLK